jgi:transposase InsO family protein
MSRNAENRSVPIGQLRSNEPTKPRQMVSLDIMYLPKSSKGHTHALIIADMFSMYISFFPLKGKSSEQVATALRSYFSLQGIPELVYSDNDPSFLDEVKKLLSSYNIKHATSFPYKQNENKVESQVRNFKNLYRASLLNNDIFRSKDWNVIYPLVVIRFNTMITKYGISRELAHFQDELDSHLPIIVDMNLANELYPDLNKLSKNF